MATITIVGLGPGPIGQLTIDRRAPRGLNDGMVVARISGRASGHADRDGRPAELQDTKPRDVVEESVEEYGEAKYFSSLSVPPLSSSLRR